MRRRALAITAAFAVALIGGAIAVIVFRVSDDPFGGVTEAERAYLLPDAASRGPGSPCGRTSSCEGPMSADAARALTWWSLSAWRPATDGSYRVGDIEGVAVADLDQGVAATIRVQLWRPTADAIDDALADGLEVWVGVERDGDPPLVEFAVAFDDDGRAAGLGSGGARVVSSALATGASATGAPTARAYLLEVVTGDG